MKFVNLKCDLTESKIISNLKKEANYFYEGKDAFGQWDLADFDKSKTGIHVSYKPEKKKICAYYESGEKVNFLFPIVKVFNGKIVEKEGKLSIKGIVKMSPMYNLTAILTLLGILGLGYAYKNQLGNITLLGVLLLAYFLYLKNKFNSHNDRLKIYLNAVLYNIKKKGKKNAPNKKKGKWAGKHY